MAGLPFLARGQLPTPRSPSFPVFIPADQDAIPSLPITPPESIQGTPNLQRSSRPAVSVAMHVMSTERAGLAYLENFYRVHPGAQMALSQAVDQIVSTSRHGGKVIITGVGKSGKIGQKIEATFKSLGIDSTFLSPTDALHGDLGTIKARDTILMVSFSGKTSELFALLPHISESVPIISISSPTQPSACPLVANRANSLLLPAPIHEPERTSFGIATPTTSTTVALALGDSLALAVAHKLHAAFGKNSAEVFMANHPGGAIGAAATLANVNAAGPALMSDVAVSVNDVHIADSRSDNGAPTGLDVLQTAVRSTQGWVAISPNHIISPRKIQQLCNVEQTISTEHSAVIEKQDWISILGSCRLDDARQWILSMRAEERGRSFLKKGTILGVVDQKNEVSGVVEIEDVVGEEALEACPA